MIYYLYIITISYIFLLYDLIPFITDFTSFITIRNLGLFINIYSIDYKRYFSFITIYSIYYGGNL